MEVVCIHSEHSLLTANRFALAALLLAVWVLASTCAVAESSVKLPENLRVMGKDAFAGTSLSEATTLTLPQNLTESDAEFFKNMTSLMRIIVLGNVQLGELPISWSNARPMLIEAEFNTAAMDFAVENGIDYRADTVYRALLVGNTYTGTVNQLNGPDNDVKAMGNMLARFGQPSYRVTKKINLSKSGVYTAIRDAFAGAKASDVSLFYFSGHGYAGTGNLVCTDYIYRPNGSSTGMMNSISPAELRAALDHIPGRKIVIIDSCYSGNFVDSAAPALLARDASAVPSVEETCSSIVSAFSGPGRSMARSAGNLSAGGYYVLAASAANEKSYSGEFFQLGAKSQYVGLCTYYLCEAAGYDALLGKSVALAGDTSGDGVLTLDELCRYTRKKVLWGLGDIVQTVMCSPAGDNAFGVFRLQ